MNPKLAAAIGAIVGAFLMPSTWLLLVALTAGRAALDNLSGVDDPAPADNPFEGLPDPEVAAQRQRSRTADPMT